MSKDAKMSKDIKELKKCVCDAEKDLTILYKRVDKLERQIIILETNKHKETK